MKILHLVPSYKPAYIYGGPVESIASLCETLAKAGNNVTVYTTTANGKVELDVKPGKEQNINGVKVFYFKRQTKDPLHLSIALIKNLYKHCNEFDVVHIHSWWNIPTFAGAWICKHKKVKLVLSPRGMLSNYILRHTNSSLKKWAHKLIGKKLLQYSLLHATSYSEMNECHKIIPGWTGVVMPNINRLSQINFCKTKNEVFTIVFLSRIHPKKGLELLFQAISGIEYPLRLQIAGDGDAGCIKKLKTLAKQLKIEDKIQWLGWQGKAEKFEVLMQADLFVLTSYNENFGNVVIEALHVGTPVLITEGVALSSFVKENNLGWVCAASVESIKENLIAAISGNAERKNISRKAPAIVQDNFSAEALGSQYQQFYFN